MATITKKIKRKRIKPNHVLAFSTERYVPLNGEIKRKKSVKRRTLSSLAEELMS